MSGIESLTLTNFQAHKRLTLELDPRVTCIVGATDQGKSAVLRGFRWLALNRPLGDAFVRWGTRNCEVGAVVDGREVVRRKTASFNGYLLDGEPLAAVGAGVPEAVSDLLELGDLHFARQHDPPFWVSLTPGELSAALNEVVNLDLIDRTLGSLASSLRQAKVEESVARERLGAAERERDGLARVPEAVAAWEAVLELDRDASRIDQDRLGLIQTLQEGDTLTGAVGRLQGAVKTILEGIRAEEAALETDSLRDLLEDGAGLVKMGKLGKVGEDWGEVERWQAEAEARQEECRELEEVLGQIRMLQGGVESWTLLAGEAEQSLRDASGGMCPVCGQELPSEGPS